MHKRAQTLMSCSWSITSSSSSLLKGWACSAAFIAFRPPVYASITWNTEDTARMVEYMTTWVQSYATWGYKMYTELTSCGSMVMYVGVTITYCTNVHRQLMQEDVIHILTIASVSACWIWLRICSKLSIICCCCWDFFLCSFCFLRSWQACRVRSSLNEWWNVTHIHTSTVLHI